MAHYLLSQKDGLFLLSNEDPLESFFGEQRGRRGRSYNPNVASFLNNAQAVRLQMAMAIGHGGNVRKRKEQWKTDINDLRHPLQKHPRKSLQFG